MSRSFSFHPEAEAELREAVRYYEKEAAGLGVEFAAHVRLAVDQLFVPKPGPPCHPERT